MTSPDAFHEIRFPIAVSFGATGGPVRRNEIVALTSGHEKRNARQAHSRRSYDAGTGLRSIDDVHDVIAFFEARRGSLHGFRFRDPFDWKSCRPTSEPDSADQLLGIGDGTTTSFRLVKTYGEGEDAYVRPIAKPVAETVRVAVAGIEVLPGEGFAVDATTGMVSLLPGHVPMPGAAVTAGFVFDVPVRFDSERLSISLASFRAGQIASIPILEVLT